MAESEESKVKKPNQAVMDKADGSLELTVNLFIGRDFTFPPPPHLGSWSCVDPKMTVLGLSMQG